MGGFYFLMIAFSLFCCIDIILSVKGFLRGGPKGRTLGCACLSAFLVTVSYTASLFVRDYHLYSVLSSVYFGGIDLSLMSMMILNWYFINASATDQKPGLGYKLLCAYGIFDMLVFLVNPFCEISIRYVYNGNPIACYSYEMGLLYRLHLTYAYLIIAVVLFELIKQSIRAPHIYARRYIYCVYSLIAVVLINAAYLYAPDLFGEEHVDFSLLGYSVIAFSYYWFCYDYATHGLLNHFHSWIFENIDQGLVLFDYDDKLMLHNRKAEKMLPITMFRENTDMDTFIEGCGLHFRPSFMRPYYSFQCFVGGRSLRCDYSVHLDKKGRKQGSLLVFSNITSQFDLLTGFHTWADFKENADKLVPLGADRQIVATFDINSLRDINNDYGHTNGDHALQLLAEEMRAAFPPATVFTRSREASLAAITGELDKEAVEQIVARIQDSLQHNAVLECPIQVQSSVSMRGRESVVDTIRLNLQSMRTKKLMDRSSVHSDVLRSLLQALSQCDPDTGEHVQRTQKTGEELGRRINLSDHDQSNLALLAIMHDIGKIGIPLEILNKPGKLNESEWKMMKTHVYKGYQIASSSKEFSEISDMILYHHERWDGRGYPEGLQGEQIPLLSRIISVVDAYDAMTNDRAYRKALSESAARSELLRGAGSQFDPNIVREFLEMLEENDQKQGITVTTMSQQESVKAYGLAEKKVSHPADGNVHPIAYCIYELNPKHQIVQVDDNFEAFTGYSRGDVATGKLTQMSLIFPEDLAEYQSYIQSDREQDIYLYHRLWRKDGSAVFVNCYGHDYYDSSVGERRARIVIMDSNAPLVENRKTEQESALKT